VTASTRSLYTFSILPTAFQTDSRIDLADVIQRLTSTIRWGLMPLPGRGRIFVVLMLAVDRIM
jgi:hypothetical protein